MHANPVFTTARDTAVPQRRTVWLGQAAKRVLVHVQHRICHQMVLVEEARVTNAKALGLVSPLYARNPLLSAD